jgi:dienelactone hydrolase
MKRKNSPMGTAQIATLMFLASQKNLAASNVTLSDFFGLTKMRVRELSQALAQRGMVIYLATRGGPTGSKSVTALTDAGMAYVKNQKEIEAYQSRVEEEIRKQA